jgi:hypothetical protein
MNTKLFAGLEDFMEDVSVDVEVNAGEVATEDAIAETAETVEAATEVEESAADAEATEVQAEMTFRRFEELKSMLNHAKKYGVDRTFLALANRNGILSNGLGISLPACEAFGTVGSPYSAESQAVIAGLESAWETVKDFIKKLWARIVAMCKRAWEWIRNFFGKVSDQYKRLQQKIRGSKVLDDKLLNGRTLEVFEINDVKKVVDAIVDANTAFNADEKKIEEAKATPAEVETAPDAKTVSAVEERIADLDTNFATKEVSATQAQKDLAEKMALIGKLINGGIEKKIQKLEKTAAAEEKKVAAAKDEASKEAAQLALKVTKATLKASQLSAQCASKLIRDCAKIVATCYGGK